MEQRDINEGIKVLSDRGTLNMLIQKMFVYICVISNRKDAAP